MATPLVGLTKPPTIYSRVDFPQPEGPRMETKAPSSIVSEISDKAKWSWRPEVRNTCETWSISIMAFAGPRAGADSASTPLGDGDAFIPASLPDEDPSGTAAFPVFRTLTARA